MWTPCFFVSHTPMHEVAPRAVRMADAIEAISCTINLAVSFLVIAYLLSLVVAASGLVVIGITASTGVAALVTTLRA